MKLFIKYCQLFLIFLSFSCEEIAEYEFSTEKLNFIVVNGHLTNEKKSHQIIVSHPVNTLGEEAEPVSNAFVSIYDGDSLHELQEDFLNKGAYNTDQNFRAVINKPYTLLIITTESKYYASAYMRPVSPFNPLKYRFDEEKNMFTIDSVNQAFDKSESAIYEIQIDWTNVVGYDNMNINKKKATLYYYTLSTIDISEVFAPEKEKIYFPAGTTIIESKYSVTPEHAGFIRSMLLETEWRGGLFDVAQGNLETNLSQGAFGFFAISTVIRDTLTVK